MTRQDATTCAAAVAPGVEARGLPKLSRSPSQVSPLQGGGEWSRWREAALRPVSPYRHSSCQSRVVLLRPNLGSCCWPAIIDLHDDIPLFLIIFFIYVSKLNTINRYITTTYSTTRFLPTYTTTTLPHFPSVPSLLSHFLGIHSLTSAPRIFALYRLHSLLLLLPGLGSQPFQSERYR
jgi:hypothetical protein